MLHFAPLAFSFLVKSVPFYFFFKLKVNNIKNKDLLNAEPKFILVQKIAINSYFVGFYVFECGVF
ncbi:hypothetical protein HMPREF0765_2536 [Sphingobacterium spiritivorum ATCC 33300]|uniref:Uncharacterized protein n=1 Tax=Sphingobacterium spiritivorum ATCC 33300 TaxID=525372 RepID=C2FYY0_SPHSI|nr:hypothetical protein HMPREF0765_2536 [Sphingobacterium spiritivorum ATCC 33300]